MRVGAGGAEAQLIPMAVPWGCQRGLQMFERLFWSLWGLWLRAGGWVVGQRLSTISACRRGQCCGAAVE